MGNPLDLELARERREELLREAAGRRLALALREDRRDDEEGLGGVVVRWGLAEDEAAVADLLQLNGMPRWVAFEERFIVAERDGRVLGALRYRTESKRLLLGLLVVDPWAGEGRLGRALYSGAADLARELGVGEVVASGARAGYAREAGYRRRGRGWRLVVEPASGAGVGAARGRWRRVLSLFGSLAVPFHSYR